LEVALMNDAAAVKTGGHYTLRIVYDNDPLNPREDYDNLAKMVCWHRRYNLGDKHEYSEPGDFLRDLVRKTTSEQELISYVKDGKANGLRLQYNRSGREWELQYYDGYGKKWHTETSFGAPLDLKSGVLYDYILDDMGSKDLMEFAQKHNVIAALYLYDHSVQSISMDTFIGRAQHAQWDSGQVGFIYVSHEDIAKEYGAATDENIEKAMRVMKAETETYDYYLRGSCYGFQLYLDGEEVDSCWGFLGDFEEAKAAIRAYLPEDAVELVGDPHYGQHDAMFEPEYEREA
jgi:hypothetical protein